MESDESQWYAVRCVFRFGADADHLYQERITLWQAGNLDEAIALAEDEAAAYAEGVGAEHLGLAQAYWLPAPPESGVDVFSLMRESDLEADAYLDQFFDTGRERDTLSDET